MYMPFHSAIPPLLEIYTIALLARVQNDIQNWKQSGNTVAHRSVEHY